MNTELHASKQDSDAPASIQQIACENRKPPSRSLIVLICLTLIALGLMILPRPALYYPNVISDTGNMQLDFLLYGRQDSIACESAAAAIANAITASCRECRIQSQTCLLKPPPEMLQRFDETPLDVPSARLANGIVTYNAQRADIALATCQESERQAALKGDQAKVVCYPAGASRPHTAFEKQNDQAEHTTFTLLLTIVGALIASLTIAIAAAHYRSSALKPPFSVLKSYPWLEKLSLAGIDTLVLLGTFLALSWPASDNINHWSRLDRSTVISHGMIIIITIGWFWLLLEHYARRRPFWDELREIIRVLTIMFMVSGAAAFIAGLETDRSSHLITWALNFLLIPLGRAGARQLLDDLGLWQRPALIIGTGENAREAYLAIKSELNMGYRVLGFAKAGSDEAAANRTITIDAETFPIIAPTTTIERMLTEHGNPQLIVALDNLNTPENQALVQQLATSQHNIHVIPAIRGLPLFGTQLSHFFSHEVLFLTVRNNLSRRSHQWIKRAFDIVASAALIIGLSPLMLYVAWRIWREDGGPVIFRQPRLAKNDGEFPFLKFRSMVKDADQILARWKEQNSPEWQQYYANNFKLVDDPRILPVGRWIRSTSIDELPQLFNVLRGEMSLVGPRPLLARELADYKAQKLYRLSRPGLTGLWQISGRSTTTFDDRANLDTWYVQNWSLWYDIAILFKTIDVVMRRDGAH